MVGGQTNKFSAFRVCHCACWTISIVSVSQPTNLSIDSFYQFCSSRTQTNTHTDHEIKRGKKEKNLKRCLRKIKDILTTRGLQLNFLNSYWEQGRQNFHVLKSAMTQERNFCQTGIFIYMCISNK